MKVITLTNAQAALLTTVLGVLVGDNSRETHILPGGHPAYQRSVFLSDASCGQLSGIVRLMEDAGV